MGLRVSRRGPYTLDLAPVSAILVALDIADGVRLSCLAASVRDVAGILAVGQAVKARLDAVDGVGPVSQGRFSPAARICPLSTGLLVPTSSRPCTREASLSAYPTPPLSAPLLWLRLAISGARHRNPRPLTQCAISIRTGPSSRCLQSVTLPISAPTGLI